MRDLPVLRQLEAPRLAGPALLVLALGAAAPDPVWAQEEELAERARSGWVFQGELTTVLSQGNSESLTLGFGALARREWDRDALRLEASAIRTESARITRLAVGTVDDFSVRTDRDTELTAAQYGIRARYDRTLSDRFFAYTGVDWLRNTFAGIDSRFLLALGAGNTWMDRDDVRFKTTYAATWTFQQDVVEDPFHDSDFPGVRIGWEYWNRLTSTADLESVLLGDVNLSETEDVRGDLLTSLTVEVSDALALKPSLQLQWRNLPALTEVPLVGPGGDETGEVVRTELEKLDTFFRLALVLTL